MTAKYIIFVTMILLCKSESPLAFEDPARNEAFEQNEIADSINEFGLKLLLKIMKQNLDSNVAISPASVAGLLALALLGSVGNTYDEIAASLGFSKDILENRRNHEEFGELLKTLSEGSRTMYANSIVIDAHMQLRTVYRDYLSRVYHGDAFVTDFKDTNKTKIFINEWIKNQTKGQIDEFLKHTLPLDTKAVLLSAIYFSGQWMHPFLPEFTKLMPFRKTIGEVLVELMLNAGQFDYLYQASEGLHIIGLPYNDSTNVMYVAKPTRPERMTLLQMMERLNNTKINDLINRMTKKLALVRFPKLNIRSNTNLEAYLEDLGVKSIFDPRAANLALMIDNNKRVNITADHLIPRIGSDDIQNSGLKETLNSLPNPGIYVDKVVHDVKLTVNEFGTEVVAATAGFIARTAELFYADSPFFMFIRDTKTKFITFSAVIYEPDV